MPPDAPGFSPSGSATPPKPKTPGQTRAEAEARNSMIKIIGGIVIELVLVAAFFWAMANGKDSYTTPLLTVISATLTTLLQQNRSEGS